MRFSEHRLLFRETQGQLLKYDTLNACKTCESNEENKSYLESKISLDTCTHDLLLLP